MRILKLGVDPRPRFEPPWWFDLEATCAKCGTVVMVESTDHVTRTSTYDPVSFTPIDMAITPAIRLTCPVCSETITLNRPAATTTLAKYNANPTECRQNDRPPGQTI